MLKASSPRPPINVNRKTYTSSIERSFTDILNHAEAIASWALHEKTVFAEMGPDAVRELSSSEAERCLSAVKRAHCFMHQYNAHVGFSEHRKKRKVANAADSSDAAPADALAETLDASGS